jgi:two-component system chemotaxis response regulator CheB
MDIEMPELDGFQATKRIMTETPTPIVIVSGHVDGQVGVSMKALQAGALTLVSKPGGLGQASFEQAARELVDVVKAMAEVKVIRHHTIRAGRSSLTRARASSIEAVAIAASTGGPVALRRLLQDLPGSFPAPILLVQHISSGFLDGYAQWLDGDCGLRVRIAAAGERLEAGTVYVAAEDRHLGVRSGRAVLADEPPIGGFKPAGTFLFESVAKAYGARALGVILTGMGRDGVDGLRELKAAGGRVLAQDERSSVVYGMPKAAVTAGVVDEVLPLGLLGRRLVELTVREEDPS